MKKVLVSAIVSVVVLTTAFSTGYMSAYKSYKAELLTLELATIKAGEATQQQVNNIEQDYKEQLDVINSRKPATITERVYVKTTAKCAMPATDGSAVDDGRTTARVELATETIRSLERMTFAAEQQYANCRVRLSAWQMFAKEVGIKVAP